MALRQYGHAAMHTEFALFIAGQPVDVSDGAAGAAWALVDKFDALFNRFIDTSEPAQIARLKPGEVLVVSPEMMDCLVISSNVYAATGGAFDVTVGALMDAFRKVGNRWAGLRPDERKAGLAASGMNRLVLDPDGCRVSVTADGEGGERPLEIDFGGIAKGYALDAVRELFTETWGITDFLIHGGTSTVLAVGNQSAGKAGWPCGIAGDWAGRLGYSTVSVKDLAISGSGFEVKGEHVADLRTGSAARTNPAAWSCATSAAVSDALSTAFMAMSWTEIEAACDALSEVKAGALVPREQGEWLDAVRKPVRMTPVFKQLAHA